MKKFKYRGYNIAVNSELLFLVDFNKEAKTEEDRDLRVYQSAAEAKADIDNHIKLEASKKLKPVKLEALSSYGESTTITGVHSGSITHKKLKNHTDELYPPEGFVKEAIKELILAKRRVADLERILKAVEIDLYHPGDHYSSSYSWKKRGVERNTEILLSNYEKVSKLARSLKTVQQALRALKVKKDD